MPVLGAIAVPHPPLIVPDVGRGQERQIEQTAAAYRTAARFLLDKRPQTVVLITPHSVLYQDYLHVSPGSSAKGSLARFGAPGVKIHANYDEELVRILALKAALDGFPAGTDGARDAALDHASLVPLWFLREAAGGELPFEVVRVSLSGMDAATHYAMGQCIARAADEAGRQVCVVASGDLSHYLKEDGPYGLRPEGAVYDAQVMDVLGRGAFDELLAMPQTLCERAGECGQRSFQIMAGCLDGQAVRAQALSYQSVTGVGYGVCTFEPLGEDPARRYLDPAEKGKEHSAPVALAIQAFTQYVRAGQRLARPEDLPAWLLNGQAGVFVTLHKRGLLRGCVGTIGPTQPCIADEILHNAVSAAVRDPRFPPVTPEELSDITCSVDVLEPPEDISAPEMLDPARYGIIVSRGTRRGLLLPMLEGIDTAQEQLRIAKEKAGIRAHDPVTLQRFKVTRYL